MGNGGNRGGGFAGCTVTDDGVRLVKLAAAGGFEGGDLGCGGGGFWGGLAAADRVAEATLPVAAPAPVNFCFTSATVSLLVARMAIGLPTATLSPSFATTTARVPASNDSISMTALSVSTSAIFSPAATLSPSRLSHLTTVPSDIVSDNWGMVISVGISGVPCETVWECGGGGVSENTPIRHHSHTPTPLTYR